MLMNVELQLIGFVVAALLAAGVVSFLATPLVRTLAQKVGAMDVPKDAGACTTTPFPVWAGWLFSWVSC